MGRRGFIRGALYLVRPDGYVALADPGGDPQRLRPYFTASGLAGALQHDNVTAQK
jgi:hypothetical protein